MLVKIVHSTGWRRVLRGLHLAGGDADADPAGPAGDRTDLEALGLALGGLRVADPDAEPDPRRAVIACYLSMLEAAARHGPERLDTETPTEYLRRMLAMTGAGSVAANIADGAVRASPLQRTAGRRVDAVRRDRGTGLAPSRPPGGSRRVTRALWAMFATLAAFVAIGLGIALGVRRPRPGRLRARGRRASSGASASERA